MLFTLCDLLHRWNGGRADKIIKLKFWCLIWKNHWCVSSLSHCGIYLGFFQSAWVAQEHKPHWVSSPNISFSENPTGNQYIHMCIFNMHGYLNGLLEKWISCQSTRIKKYKIHKNIQIKLIKSDKPRVYGILNLLWDY